MVGSRTVRIGSQCAPLRPSGDGSNHPCPTPLIPSPFPGRYPIHEEIFTYTYRVYAGTVVYAASLFKNILFLVSKMFLFLVLMKISCCTMDGTLLASYFYLAQRIVRLHSRWVVPFLYYSWNISRSRCSTTTPSTSSLLPIERASEPWHSRCEALDGGALRRDARNVDFFTEMGQIKSTTNRNNDSMKEVTRYVRSALRAIPP